MIEETLSVSVKAPFLLAAAIAPSMARDGGVVVNVGSISGLVGIATALRKPHCSP
jgi:NAD(P)-dependent dehydrogenase (short-subunit alcohol dehydrogenase family)